MMKKRMRIKRGHVLVCLVGIGCLTLLYEGLAFSTLQRFQADQFIDCNPFRTRTIRSNTTTNTEDSANIFEGLETKKVLKEFAGFHDRDIDTLGNKPVVNTVHFVWCGNRTFEFAHYLSVLSAWKMLQPDIIEFHAQFPPIVDKYHAWFDEVVRTIPAFAVKSFPKNWDGEEKGCGFWFGLAVIDDRGGIYIGENVILQPEVFNFREKDSTLFFSQEDSGNYYITMAMAKHNDPEFRKFRREFNQKHIVYKEHYSCQQLTIDFIMNESFVCYVLNTQLFPNDIFQLNSSLGAYTRKLLYGREDLLKEKSFLPGKIPKIVHYVWFGAKKVDFMMYLSMLSTLFILNAEKVFIYTDGYMSGSYLDRIQRDHRVVLVRREKPEFIFGKTILYGQHRSDIVRAEVLLKYGGIYMDWDVLWLRDVDDVIHQGYDVVANFDHMPRPPFPESINLGVLMSKPKATFIKRWQDALINYRTRDFLYNAVELPYKIFEMFPEYIHIERRLQVMCFRLKCHPAYHPDFKRFSSDQPFDWRKDVYSIHFTYPDPPELASEEACRNGTGRFADIGRFILQHSSKLD